MKRSYVFLLQFLVTSPILNDVTVKIRHHVVVTSTVTKKHQFKTQSRCIFGKRVCVLQVGSFLGQFVAHGDDDDGNVDGDDDDDGDDDEDEDGQSQAGPFLGQFVRPRLRAGLSCCGNDGSFDVSGLVPRASHTFACKKIKNFLSAKK